MSSPGSASPRFLSPAAALAAALAGIAAMVFGGRFVALSLGFGLPATIATGEALLAVPALLAVLVIRRASWRHALALGGANRRMLVLSVLLGAALWVASAGLLEVQAFFWPPSPEFLERFLAIHRALAPTGPFDALVSVTVIAVLPGAAEETVMRGVLLPSLVAPLGAGGAVAGVALLFALMHLDAYLFAFTLTVGVVLGVLRLRTGSLWPPIVTHASLNALTFAIAPLTGDLDQTTYTPQTGLGLALLLVGTALAVPLMMALRGPIDSPSGPS
jgi:membrane protease YdiL (CAAX protease family)